MKTNINNFYTNTGGYVVSKSNNKGLMHKSIVGFIPQYSNLNNEVNDANMALKIEPSFPLVATKTASGINFGGTPTAIISNRSGNNTQYAFTTSGIFTDQSGGTLYNFASGYSTTFNETADIQQVFDKVFIACSNQDYVYYCDVDGTSPNRTAGFGSYGIEIPKAMVVFLNGLYISGGSNGDTLYKIDSTLTKRTVASISNHTIRYGINYNDRYMIYFASISQSAQPDGTNWYMLVHDGTLPEGSTNGVFKYRTKINGQFMGHAQIGDAHLVFHQDGSYLVCSQISNYSLSEVGRIKNVTMAYSSTSTTGVNYRNRVTYIQDYIFIPCKFNGDNVVLIWNIKTGENAFVYKNNTAYPRIIYSRTSQNTPVVEVFNGTNPQGTKLINATGSISDCSYRSNYLQMTADDGTVVERVKISKIHIVLDETFPTTNDKISFTIRYSDKLQEPDIQTFTKANITTGYSDTDVQIDTTRVIINNIGIVGTEFSFEVDVDVTTTSWDLVIREIIVEYEPVQQMA